MEDDKRTLIFMVIFLVIVGGSLVWMKPKVDSFSNGGPNIPEECRGGFQENMTYSGQTVTNYFWTDKCCTKRLTGYSHVNQYTKICWDKTEVSQSK